MPQARYFKEANTPFVLPGGITMSGIGFGLIFGCLFVSLGLGIMFLPSMIGGIWLGKQLGKDPTLVKSVVTHLWQHKAARYVTVAPTVRRTPVIINSASRGSLPLSEWLQDTIAREEAKRIQNAAA